MIYNDIKTVFLDKNDISISPLEIAARLKTKVGYKNDLTENLKAELLEIMAPKFCYANSSITFEDEGFVVFDFGKIKSYDLAKNLKNSKSAYILAATLGIKVDRFIAKQTVISKVSGFIADAISSAAVEAVCDYADEYLRGGKGTMRFSAGYGDMDIKYQKDILNRLSSMQTVGIALTESYLMTPQKSITAILGV